MNWSEIALFALVVLFIPSSSIIYMLGREHGSYDWRREQRYILGDRTWLWVNGRFYPIDATEDQMEQVMAFEETRESVTKEMVMQDANVEAD